MRLHAAVTTPALAGFDCGATAAMASTVAHMLITLVAFLPQVGHNPSEHAFHTGHFYSNPSNRMWSILISTGIAPPGSTGQCAA